MFIAFLRVSHSWSVFLCVWLVTFVSYSLSSVSAHPTLGVICNPPYTVAPPLSSALILQLAWGLEFEVGGGSLLFIARSLLFSASARILLRTVRALAVTSAGVASIHCSWGSALIIMQLLMVSHTVCWPSLLLVSFGGSSSAIFCVSVEPLSKNPVWSSPLMCWFSSRGSAFC